MTITFVFFGKSQIPEGTKIVYMYLCNNEALHSDIVSDLIL